MRENFRTNFVDGLQKKWKKLRYVISTKNALTTGKKRNDRVILKKQEHMRLVNIYCHQKIWEQNLCRAARYTVYMSVQSSFHNPPPVKNHSSQYVD